MFRPYTDLIKADIKWVRDEQHWQSMNAQAMPPRNDAHRRRCWIDPAAADQLTGNIWGPPVVTGAREYDFLARDANGRLTLAHPSDPVLQWKYSQSVLAAIGENSFFWAGSGVPYTMTLSPIGEGLGGFNFSTTLPVIDYPIALRTDAVLVPGALARKYGATGDAEVFWIEYQEFIRLCRPPGQLVTTPEQRVALVAMICGRTDYSAADKLQAIRKAVTDYGTSYA